MISSTDSDQRPASHNQMGLTEVPTSWSVGLIGDGETVPTAFPKDKTWLDNADMYMHANALTTHLLQLHCLQAQGLQLTLQKLPCSVCWAQLFHSALWFWVKLFQWLNRRNDVCNAPLHYPKLRAVSDGANSNIHVLCWTEGWSQWSQQRGRG